MQISPNTHLILKNALKELKRKRTAVAEITAQSDISRLLAFTNSKSHMGFS